MHDDIQDMTRRELKQLARERLRQPEIRRPLMVAAVLPILITAVVMTIILNIPTSGLDFQSMSDAAILEASVSESRQTMMQSLMQQLLTIFFTTGLSLTALDVIRRSEIKLTPTGIWLRLFNSRYFWSVLLTALLTRVAVGVGMALFVIPGILLTYGLSMVYFVLYDKKETGARVDLFGVLATSYRITRGYKFDLFVLELSFFGWYLVGVLTLGLGFIWIYPYVQLTNAAYYEQLRLRYEATHDEQVAS